MIAAGSGLKGARVNVLGLTFKEDCGDLRNSKVIDIIRELEAYGVDVCVSDPQASAEGAMHEYGIELWPWTTLPRADAIVLAVAHREYLAMPLKEVTAKVVDGGAFIDVKSAFDPATLTRAGYRLWRL